MTENIERGRNLLVASLEEGQLLNLEGFENVYLLIYF